MTDPDELVTVLECWGPNGEHYLEAPSGHRVDLPQIEHRDLRPDDYVFVVDVPSEPPTLKWLPDTTRGRRS